jgi:hypothetical protein
MKTNKYKIKYKYYHLPNLIQAESECHSIWCNTKAYDWHVLYWDFSWSVAIYVAIFLISLPVSKKECQVEAENKQKPEEKRTVSAYFLTDKLRIKICLPKLFEQCQ